MKTKDLDCASMWRKEIKVVVHGSCSWDIGFFFITLFDTSVNDRIVQQWHKEKGSYPFSSALVCSEQKKRIILSDGL